MKFAQTFNKQRGVSMIEVAIWAVIAGVIAIAVMNMYNPIRSGQSASTLGDRTLVMVSDIQKFWTRANDYSTVTAEEISKLELIRSPLKYDAGVMYDAYGNPMALNGSRISFALTLGGTESPLSSDDCATIITRLEPVAQSIRIGTSAEAAAGAITGGNVYKSGSTVSQTGLTAGCGEANTKIAAQFR